MPPFRDDQIMIIAPGSQTTLAQLGLPESFTPAKFRLRSRMFRGQREDEFEAVKVRKVEKGSAGQRALTETAETDPEPEWEEDPSSEQGAVWPIQKGSVVDWPCFYALMEHVYNTVNPPWHTPILIISEPAWTHKEYEKVTQFFFEKFKSPALAMMDSAIATSYAYGVPTATVVDVGLDKADISCVVEFMLQDVGRSLAVPDCGGQALTDRLQELLKERTDFTQDVCEQLKKSTICEILDDEGLPTADNTSAGNPAAAASTGADGAAPGQRKASVVSEIPRGPGPGTQVGDEKKLGNDDGVLDVASIVTSGNMTEILAQKEREKAEKAAAKQQAQKKAAEAQAGAQKPIRLPNSKRLKNTFFFEDPSARKTAPDVSTAQDEDSAKSQPTSDPAATVPTKPIVDGEPSNVNNQHAEGAAATPYRREIEVGVERFQSATGGIIERLAEVIYRTIQSCPEINKRGELWDSLVILGNGARVRGFKEAVLAALQTKYLISPSSATIFTSEIPSNISTPGATGANTPQPQQHFPGLLPQPGAGVNPLLHAALTAQNPQFSSHLGTPSAPGGLPQQPGFPPSTPQQPHTPSHLSTPQHLHGVPPPPQFGQALQQQSSIHLSSSHTHAQTPTSIRFAKIPEYFPEWKEAGYEEAAFLGAQVASKLLFVVDGGASKGFMTRSDYNDQGPSGIHDVRL